MKLRKMVERAIELYNGSIEIELENNNKTSKNIPVLIIDEDIVSEGKVLSVREITKIIKNKNDLLTID